MEALFIKILNLSIAAGWFVLGVILIRLLFKKAPKFFRCILWALVGVRLVCPFSFESVLSLIPSAETVPQNIVEYVEPEINSGLAVINDYVNPIIAESNAVDVRESSNILDLIVSMAPIVWVTGLLIMLAYMIISFIRVRLKVAEAILVKDNIWMCDNINTPFIFGLLRPCIFIPSNINETDLEFIVAHENAHLQRYDNIWKPIGFLLLSIHWFNPVMWLGYSLFCRDIELACDEKVLRNKGTEIKKEYSNALINCSAPNNPVTACPLAFGETGVKERVKTVLKYKKPAFWISGICVIVVVVMGVCFLSNPVINRNTSREVDCSDIEGMNIGAEMPSLLYGDEKKVIFSGTCGIIVFDLENKKILDRITAEELINRGIELFNVSVSKDGKTVYIGDHIKMQGDIDNKYPDVEYQYDVDTGELLKCNEISKKIFTVIYNDTYEKNKYNERIDHQKNISNSVVEYENHLIYLQADTDWSMKSLQVVIYNLASNKKEIVDVFK